LIDKTRNLAGLLVTCHLNSKRVREEVYTRMSAGDKETYWFSHALSSTPYHFVPGYLGGIGKITRDSTGKEMICTSNLLHIIESTGEPFWFNSGIMEFKWHNNMVYLDAEGYVGHNGWWEQRETKYDQSCVSMPNGEEMVTRVSEEIKRRIDEMIELAKTYDDRMQQAGLVIISSDR